MAAPSSANALGRALFDAVRPTTATTALLLAQDAMRMGQLDTALELLQIIGEQWANDPGVLLTRAVVRARLGDMEGAEADVKQAAASNPDGLVPRMARAALAIEARRPTAAIEHLRDVVERCPDYPGVAGTLSSVLMPGPNYRDVLAALHRMLRPRGYLEIGVETGATLSLAQAERIAGVDPDFAPLRRERIDPGARLYEMTSQEFFTRHACVDVFGAVPLDLAFIDGLHRFEAALADFSAIERWAHPKSVVVMHDALPIAPVYAEGDRRTRFWVGDVWKAVYVLLEHRPDLRIRIVPTAPSGLVVIRWTGQTPAMGPYALPWKAPPTALPNLSVTDPVWPREFPLVSNDAHGYADALFGG